MDDGGASKTQTTEQQLPVRVLFGRLQEQLDALGATLQSHDDRQAELDGRTTALLDSQLRGMEDRNTVERQLENRLGAVEAGLTALRSESISTAQHNQIMFWYGALAVALGAAASWAINKATQGGDGSTAWTLAAIGLVVANIAMLAVFGKAAFTKRHEDDGNG